MLSTLLVLVSTLLLPVLLLHFTPLGGMVVRLLIALALLRLPPSQRADFRRWWTSDLPYQTRGAQLATAWGHWRQGSKAEAARLNPLKAASELRVKRFFGSFAIIGLTLRWMELSGLVALPLQRWSISVMEGMFLAVFAALMTLAVLSWRSVRRVWWRALAMIGFFVIGGLLLGADLLYMSIHYPELWPLHLVTAASGIGFAIYDYRLSYPNEFRSAAPEGPHDPLL